MDDLLRFLHTWLVKKSPPYKGDRPELDKIIPTLESEVSDLVNRQRTELGDEKVDEWLRTGKGTLGEIEDDVARWVKGEYNAIPPIRKSVAFVQFLCRVRGFETIGKIDGRFGSKTQEALPNLDAYESCLIELVQKWLKERSHDVGSETGELGEKTIRALREELANDERVPETWRPERRLVAFGQVLCRNFGFEEVGAIDGRLGPSTRGALRSLVKRLERGPEIGLALSGGGFRASIFHLGVIRRLEELGIMSRVNVISSVSGGSIIAAYYVIEMERRLRSRPLPPPEYKEYPELERQQRVEVFEEIAADFFKATDHNLRVRALLFAPFYHPLAALKLLRPGYTRANLFQAEYDRWFFRGNTLAELPHAADRDADDDAPAGPKLVINTTSLLTGKRVAFSREPLSAMKQLSKVNTNVLRLSRIVGASAGVPGLFPPTPVGGDLLVDGGVADNQGLEGLWAEGCDVLLVSDASGQMERAHGLKRTAVAVLRRTNSIFQFQVRNQLVRRLLDWRRVAPSEWQREFSFVHLFLSLKDRKGLEDKSVPSEYVAALGRMRTDLDEFNPVEREALMYHGYSLIDSQLKQHCPNLWKRSEKEAWAPATVREELTVPRLFDERLALEGRPLPEELSDKTTKRRMTIKGILEAGAGGLLIRRSVARHGLKAAVLLVMSWLLPLLLFGLFAWRSLENALVALVSPFVDAVGTVFGQSSLPGWVQTLTHPLAVAMDRWGDWPITREGFAAAALFLLVNYLLIFFAFSVLRWYSRRWDARVYSQLTGGGLPEEAWVNCRMMGIVGNGRELVVKAGPAEEAHGADGAASG